VQSTCIVKHEERFHVIVNLDLAKFLEGHHLQFVGNEVKGVLQFFVNVEWQCLEVVVVIIIVREG